MSEQTQQQRPISWATRRDEKARRMQMVEPWLKGPVLAQEKIVEALESIIVPGDRIVMEGDNQKQADFLSRSLVQVDAKKIHDLHLIISSIDRPEHLKLFELGIARKVDYPSSVAELSASIAHQLSQPLTSMLANAQA